MVICKISGHLSQGKVFILQDAKFRGLVLGKKDVLSNESAKKEEEINTSSERIITRVNIDKIVQ